MTVPETLDAPGASGAGREPRASRGVRVTRPQAPEAPGYGSAAPAISPRARRLAKQLGIDWRRISGTGRTGRITEDDVRAAAADQTAGGGLAGP